MNTVDMVILATIIIPGITGFLRGFVLTAVSLLGTIANWYLAIRFYPYILRLLYGSTALVDSIMGMASKAHSPENAAFIILGIISFALTYLLINLAIKIIISVVNGIANLPLLRGINRVGGLAAGLAEGFALTCFIFLLLNMFKGILPEDIMASVKDSALGNWFLTYNPFANLMPVDLYIWREKLL